MSVPTSRMCTRCGARTVHGADVLCAACSGTAWAVTFAGRERVLSTERNAQNYARRLMSLHIGKPGYVSPRIEQR